MKKYAIFLRGVTPTGKNRVPMAELRAALTDAGLLDVQTYIQSGNVVARSSLAQRELQALVHAAIRERIGAALAIIARTNEQLRQVVARNPFPLEAVERTYFSLLDAPPAVPLRDALLGIDFAPDEVRIIDDTLYTLYATKHSDSKYNNNFFERKLKLVATTRNFNTLSRMIELSAG